MSSRTSRRLQSPNTKPKRRMGSASPLTRKTSQRNAKSRRHHHAGAIIVDNGAKVIKQRAPRQRQRKDSQSSSDSSPEVEMHRKQWEAYKCEVNNLAIWLTTATEKSARWAAPTNNILSIRVFLERHLGFAMELETHQHQKDTVLLQGQDLIHQYPQLSAELDAAMTAIEIQWNQLVQKLEQQFMEIEDALEGAKSNISKGRNWVEQCINTEQTKDTLDQMALRLRSRKRRDSLMSTNIQALNRQVGVFNTSSRLPSSKQQQQPLMSTTPKLSSSLSSTLNSTGGSSSDSSPESSSPGFDALYEELSDWLKEMQISVSDCNDLGVSQTRIEHMCQGYEQELQMREVSRVKLERKAHKLMSTRPNLAKEVACKLENINQRWHALQERLNPKPTPNHHAVKGGSPNAFDSSEEALSVVVEVEDIIVKLKAWLMDMERKLFTTDSITCPGNVEDMEKRMEEHKELQNDISNHAEGIKVVLTMCEVLQHDKYACTTEKERDVLQLAAFNLERRWEAIQAQARDLQCGLELKLRTFKGPEAFQSPSAIESNQSEENVDRSTEVTEDNSIILTLHSPVRSKDTKSASCQLFRPSAAKDDDAVDGYTYRMQDPSGGIDYDDLLIVREAFSENDAFSMSDTSEVAFGELDFDDVCLMRKMDFEAHGACASPPSECETPEILAMSDDMLDAYLQMEEEILLEEELMEESSLGRPIERRRNASSASDMEFWSVSPRDDPMMSSLEFSQGELLAEDSDQEPVILRAGEQGYQQFNGRSRKVSCGFSATYPPLSSSLQNDRECEMINQTVASSAPAEFEPWMSGKYSPGPIDFMSSAAEEAFDSAGSSDEEEHYGGDAEDNDIWDEREHDVTITQEHDLPELFVFEDDFKTPTKGGLYDDDYDNLQSSHKKKTTIPMATSLDIKPMKTSFFPPVVTASSAPLDWSNVPTTNDFTTPMIVKPSGTSRGFFPSLIDEDDFMAVQEALSDDAEKDGMENNRHKYGSESQLQQLRKSLTSSLGSTVIRKNLMPEFQMPSSKYPKDDLLEITDLSLSHMCESLDFMTELSHWIMPVYHDDDPPVKDTDEQPRATNKASEQETKEVNALEQNISQRLQDMQNQYSALRRSSGTQSPSLSFEDLFDDLSESSKSEVVAEDKDLTSDTESFSLSLSSHDSEKKPTRGNPVLRRVQTDLIAEESVRHESSELNVQDTSIGSIELPEFNSHPESEAFSNPGSSAATPDDDVFETSPQDSPVGPATEPFTSDTDTAAQSNTDGDDEEEEKDHQAYFTYVSQLAEACSEGELTKYFGKYHQQKCHVWSLGLSDTVGYPSSSQEDEEIGDIVELEKEIADAEIDPSITDSELALDEEVASQCSDSTDKLMEASDQLVKELQDRRRLQMEPLPESEIGSWRDVIVLWLNDNEDSEKVGEVAKTEGASIEEVTDMVDGNQQDDETTEADVVSTATQQQPTCEPPCADVTDSGVWTASPGSSMVNISAAVPADEITEDVDSGRFSDPSEEGSPVRNISPHHAPRLATLQEGTESVADDEDTKSSQQTTEDQADDRQSPEAKTASPTQSRSFFVRVMRAALPIQILIFLYIIAVIILPSVVVNGDGECSMSMTDRLMFNGHKWVPTVRYTRGPPPM